MFALVFFMPILFAHYILLLFSVSFIHEIIFSKYEAAKKYKVQSKVSKRIKQTKSNSADVEWFVLVKCSATTTIQCEPKLKYMWYSFVASVHVLHLAITSFWYMPKWGTLVWWW